MLVRRLVNQFVLFLVPLLALGTIHERRGKVSPFSWASCLLEYFDHMASIP